MTAIKETHRDDVMYCMATYPDGGTILRKYSVQPDGTNKMEIIEGTGRYEGVAQTLTAKPVVSFAQVKPDVFQWCTQQTGTYKLK